MPNKKKENRYIYSKFSIHISECVESVDDEKRSLLFIMMNRHLFSGTGNECYASKKNVFFCSTFFDVIRNELKSALCAFDTETSAWSI